MKKNIPFNIVLALLITTIGAGGYIIGKKQQPKVQLIPPIELIDNTDYTTEPYVPQVHETITYHRDDTDLKELQMKQQQEELNSQLEQMNKQLERANCLERFSPESIARATC
jgi:peptidoglycan hydrolase CwlO-like protein